MAVYYNENDLKTAAWLEELIKAKLVADGYVDTRSIENVEPSDLAGFTQCHFFAGIGGWSYALRLAGWPDDEPVWTGSCPCQPWSIANVWEGGGKGHNDERDLWPFWYPLIVKHQPSVIFGEQVANAIKRGWLDEVFCDLEAANYACGAGVLRADLLNAPHQRKRLYFVADASGKRRERYQPIECVPIAAKTSLSVDGDSFAGAWHALAGDNRNLLPCDGLSVVLEREAIRGYGNAIVPQVAATFIRAYVDTMEET